MAGHVSDAVIRRLPGYYRHLRELEAAGVVQISSMELGARMNLTPSQIRQDINCFGGFGRQGYGYKVTDLKNSIGEILGLNERHRMIIIGAGSMGSAVARYSGFAREGFVVEAIFDNSLDRIGHSIDGLTVLSVNELERYTSEHPVDIAVLSLPASCAQEMLDRVVACGIRAVWNFAPTDLNHPEDTLVVNVHLSDTLQILSYKMAHRE